MELRSATPDDATAIAEVHVRSWRVAYRGVLPDAYLDGLSVSSRRDQWTQLLADLDPPARGIAIALDGARVIGFVGFRPSDDDDAGVDVGEVAALYVDPDRWSVGAGRRLLRHAADRLGEAGCTLATLWVLDVNDRARRFYEAAGWRPDGATKVDERDTFTLREVRYATDLSP